jgi:hypothetical protein
MRFKVYGVRGHVAGFDEKGRDNNPTFKLLTELYCPVASLNLTYRLIDAVTIRMSTLLPLVK